MSENEYVISIEELTARKTVKKVVGNSDPDQTPAEAISETHQNKVTEVKQNEKVNSKINDLQKLVLTSDQESITLRNSKPKIQKVPIVLRGRKNFDRYFEPRAVSIGPIHHGNPKLNLAEEYKPKLAAKFIKESGKTTEELYNVVREKIQDLKELFHEEVIRGYDDETLSWILFLDGCSTLHFIQCYVKKELSEKFKIKVDQLVFAQQNLFLLENQIPFDVLRLLMSSSQEYSELKNSIKQFICMNVMAPEDCKESLYIHFHMDDDLDITHLLELLQKAAVLSQKEQATSTDSTTKHTQETTKAPEKIIQSTQPSFRNIHELRAAGIDLKRSKTSCSLKDVSFSSVCFTGSLQLPPLIVDDSMGPKFLNLIAYEMCPHNFWTNYEVTSYICFLDSLIDHADDVKELRSAKIIHNLLGCDEEVASLFNEIATDLVPNPVMYSHVKTKIQSHYDRRWPTWMAEAYNKYFSSPWTIMAFAATLLALFLSGVQTWYTIHPAD